MKLDFFARPLKPFMLPLAFGLGLISLTACSDDKEKDEIQQKLDLVRDRAEQLEQSQAQASQTIEQLESTRRDLEKSFAAQGQALTDAQSSLNTTTRSLEEKNAKVNELNSSIATQGQKVKQLESELNAKSVQVTAIEAEIARNKTTIADLQKAVEASSHSASELGPQLAAKIKEKEQLEAELSEVKVAKEKAMAQLSSQETELSKLKADYAVLNSTLDEKAYSGVMALLENPGPESLFGVTDWVLREAFALEADQDCLMIFNIDRQVESVVRNRNNSVPRVGGLQLIPLRTAYQKVAVCSKNGVIEAHKESGFIYKAIPQDRLDKRVLVTTRNESSCDKTSETVRSQNVFGSPYQFFYPYVGAIDGIETINILRPSSEVMEYNMGSSHPGILASSCQALLKDSGASSLAITACRLASGEKAEDLNVSLGCFTENAVESQTKIIFNK